jgi:hypothetical protein
VLARKIPTSSSRVRNLMSDVRGTIAVALLADFNVNGDSWRC